MVKNRTNIFRAYGLTAIAFVTLISSCGGNSNPAAPSAAGGAVPGDVLSALPPDGVVSLKAPPPLLQSPINNVEVGELNPTLAIGNAAPLYLPSADFTYRIEVYQVQDGGGMVLVHSNTANQTANPTNYTVDVELEQTGNFMWRARAQIGNENGPWSNAATFRTPTLITVDPPTLLSPANGADVPNSRPELIVTNGAVSANAGAVEVEYEINDGATAEGGARFKVAIGAGGTTTGMFSDGLREGPYTWRARASNGTITSDWSAPFTFTVTGGARAPDPPPGQKLPLPDESQTIHDLAALHPAALADSCQDHGGTWEFMDLTLEALRQKDARWGFNCKRGNCGDVSLDVITYHYGAGPSQGSPDVYIIDTILGHCGGNPSPAWQNMTGTGVGGWVFPR